MFHCGAVDQVLLIVHLTPSPGTLLNGQLWAVQMQCLTFKIHQPDSEQNTKPEGRSYQTDATNGRTLSGRHGSQEKGRYDTFTAMDSDKRTTVSCA